MLVKLQPYVYCAQWRRPVPVQWKLKVWQWISIHLCNLSHIQYFVQMKMAICECCFALIIVHKLILICSAAEFWQFLCLGFSIISYWKPFWILCAVLQTSIWVIFVWWSKFVINYSDLTFISLLLLPYYC